MEGEWSGRACGAAQRRRRLLRTAPHSSCPIVRLPSVGRHEMNMQHPHQRTLLVAAAASLMLLVCGVEAWSPWNGGGGGKNTLVPPWQQSSSIPRVKLPDDFVLPEPRPLTVTEKTDLTKFLKASAAFALRLATGTFVLGWKIDRVSFHFKRDDVLTNDEYALSLGPVRIRDTSSVLDLAPPKPTQNLILYGYDASPYCKRVREVFNVLDLTYDYRPCPGARQGAFSEDLFWRTGRRTVPFLIDPNTGIELFESGDIIDYLLATYGPPSDTYDRKALWPIEWEAFSVTTSSWAALLLDMPGAQRQSNARPDNEAMRPLEVWGFECSPFVRPVLTKLCSLCLPHTIVSCARGSKNRDALVKRTGGRTFQVPYLVDPNTGIEMFESAEIVEYLERVYTVQQTA